MKLLIPGIYCLLVMAGIHAQSPISQTDVINQPFHWKGQAINLLGQVPGTEEVGDNFQGQPDKLSIYRSTFQPQNLGPGIYFLRTLDSSVVSHITSRHYAITGHLIYQNVAAGSFLEMESWFAPEQPGGPELFYFSRTLADAGPMAKIEGSDAGHDFELPFDSTGAKTPLVRLVLKLHLAGSGYLEFTNVKLVQYPDAVGVGSDASQKPNDVIVDLAQSNGEFHFSLAGVSFQSFDNFEAAAQKRFKANPDSRFIILNAENVDYSYVSETIDTLRHAGISNIFFTTKKGPQAVKALAAIARQIQGLPTPAGMMLNWRSFGAGVLATLGTFCGVFSIAALARRFRRHRHQRELRRIASLDG